MTDLRTPTPEVPGTAPRPPAGPTRGALLRPVLWLLLVLALVGNTVASSAAVPSVVHLGFGAVSALCVAALVAQHLRGRR